MEIQIIIISLLVLAALALWLKGIYNDYSAKQKTKITICDLMTGHFIMIESMRELCRICSMLNSDIRQLESKVKDLEDAEVTYNRNIDKVKE